MLYEITGGKFDMIEEEIKQIDKFRGTTFGIIRLKNLAYPSCDKMKITIGEKQVFPIGFDSYGFPIISEGSFKYYMAIKERKDKAFSVVVKYEKRPFCIKRSVYDYEDREMFEFETKKPSIESLYLSDLKTLKAVLINRKMAAFLGKELNNFSLYNKYLLCENGKVYECLSAENHKDDIVKLDEKIDISCLKEVHIPGENDFCAICGKTFELEDVKKFNIDEDQNCAKVHKHCLREINELI